MEGARSLKMDSDSPGRMIGSNSVAAGGSYECDSRGRESEGDAYFEGGKSRPGGRRSRPPRFCPGRPPKRRLRPPRSRSPRLPKPPRPRSFLGGKGGCWVRCTGAPERPAPSPDMGCGAATAEMVSPSSGVMAGTNSAGAVASAAAAGSACSGDASGASGASLESGGVSCAWIGAETVPPLVVGGYTSLRCCCGGRGGLGSAGATWSYSSRCSRKALTYRKASLSSPMSTKADCIPGRTRVTRPL